MKTSFMLGLFTIMCMIPGIAYADIGIDISSKCKIMIRNNLDTSCPTIQQILALFPDTSPRHQIGDFEMIDGMLARGQPQYDIKNMKAFYRGIGNDDRIWIDPPAGIRSELQMIVIESNFGDYPIAESYSMSNNTISMGTQRHINYGCTEVLLSAEDWIFLTGDTIVHLQDNCSKDSTNFDHIKKFYFEKSFQDITTSYKYKLETWIAENLIKCKVRNCV